MKPFSTCVTKNVKYRHLPKRGDRAKTREYIRWLSKMVDKTFIETKLSIETEKAIRDSTED